MSRGRCSCACSMVPTSPSTPFSPYHPKHHLNPSHSCFAFSHFHTPYRSRTVVSSIYPLSCLFVPCRTEKIPGVHPSPFAPPGRPNQSKFSISATYAVVPGKPFPCHSYGKIGGRGSGLWLTNQAMLPHSAVIARSLDPGFNLRKSVALARTRAGLCGVGTDFWPVVDWILRALDGRHGMILQGRERHSDTLFQLRVVTLTPQGRIEVHLDVRCDALVLDVELARFRVEESPARRGHFTAIHQGRID